MISGCAVCGGELRPWTTKLERAVARCARCGHIAVPAGLALDASGRSIYEAEHSVFETDGNADYYLDDGSSLAAAEKADFVRHHSGAGGTLLDVGAGYGHFLAAAGTSSAAVGVELNRAAVEWSRSHLHVNSHVGSIYSLPPDAEGPFDVITAWDVLEHLEDPRGAIRACRAHLRPEGWLFLSTPDAGSMVARLMGARWHYLDPVQHINLFSRKNLVRVLGEEGFSVRAAVSFGRTYKINYVLNRVAYLTGPGTFRAFLEGLGRAVPQRIRNGRIQVKLFDVMGIAATRSDPPATSAPR